MTETENSLILHIQNCQNRWEDFAKQQLKKSLDLRDYIYDSEAEKSQINIKGSIKDTEKVTLSPIRTALNRIKTDLRDLEPYFVAKPKRPVEDVNKVKLQEAILDSIVLNNHNLKQIYNTFDDIVDLSFTALQVDVSMSYDKTLNQIKKIIVLNRVSDLQNIYFDSRVELDRINRDGQYVGITREKTVHKPGGDIKIKVSEHWEKEYETITYGERYDAFKDGMVCEKVAKGVIYNFTTDIEEVSVIRHTVVEDNVITKDEAWPYKKLPYILGVGVAIDNYSSDITDRLTLVPFAEHVKPAQMMLDYAATLQLYNLKMTRGSAKAMFTEDMVEGHEESWRNRNSEDSDLVYNTIKQPDGTHLPMRPEFIPDVSVSPVVSEIMSSYPQMIASLLGADLEQDISYNVSGEAIRQMQMIRHKNAKLYTDRFIEMLNCIGETLTHYIPLVYDREQYITIDDYGSTKTIPINTTQDNNLKRMMDMFEVGISAGSSPAVHKEKTSAALNAIYMATANSPLGPQIIANTLDIYADSFDTPDSPAITNRLKILVPESARKLTEGETTVKQIDQEAQQSAQQQSQQQQEIMQQELQAKMLDAQAKFLTAQSKWQEAVDNKAVAKIKANAEVARALSP